MTPTADAATEARFIGCDPNTLAQQIGRANILAISGGRIRVRRTGITLPVSNGYTVAVDLAPGDTYTVRRLFTRGTKIWIKGQVEGVYCDMVGEIAYRASCFRNVDFPTAQPVAAVTASEAADKTVNAMVGRDWRAMGRAAFDTGTKPIQGALFAEPDRLGTPDLFDGE